MEELITSKGAKILQNQKKWKRWKKAFRFLACVVVFCTTYALILPALTVEKTAYCGYEEHPEHSKEAGCYKEISTLICDLPTSAGHMHSDDCYEVENVLACGLEEGMDHVHDETCYTEERVLICGENENPGHAHTAACYEISEELICKKPIHSHTKDCYKNRDEADGQEKEEVQGNPEADTETKSDWEATLKDVELTGNWDEDLLAVAESQLGYEESTKNYLVVDGHKKGYSRYGAWYGDAYGDWCAMFVSFCLHYADIDKDMMPREANCQRWIDRLKDDEEQEYHYHQREDYLPKVGDLIFFDWDEYKTEEERVSDHIGIVAELIENLSGEVTKIRVIEGNSSDKVQYVTYKMDDKTIMGYGELPENPYKNLPPKEQTYEGKDFTVTVNYTQKAHIPDQAELKVDEILKDTEEYEAYIKEASEALELGENVSASGSEQITFARFFDIRFEVDGQQIEPEDKVDVTIAYKKGLALENEEQTAVVHFADKGTEVLEAELSQTEESKTEEELVDTFTFTQESFSVTGTIVYGNNLPFGEYMIVTEYNGRYYALTTNGGAVEVQKNGDSFTASNDSGELIWTYDEYVNGSGNYIHSADGKYLTITGNGVSISTTKSATTIGNYQNNGTWIIYNQVRTGIFSSNTYYLGFGGNGFGSVTRNPAYVWFAKLAPKMPEPTPQPGFDVAYEHNKTINYLGDGKEDPQTSLVGEDLYRLRLDMTGIRKPVDLLLVVDASGSMKGISSGDGITNGMPEVIKFLNGVAGDEYRFQYNDQVTTFNDPSCDGFIKEFFELNDRNRMAIAAFAGSDTADNDWTGNSQNPNFRYTDDAWVVKEWNDIGDTYSSVPVAEGYYPRGDNGKKGLFIEDKNWIMGTDYSAGLMVAEDMFDKLNTLDDGGEERIKVMVFLSDGMPTYSIVTTSETKYPTYDGEHYKRRGQGQDRWYNAADVSLDTGTVGINDCYIDSEISYDHYTQSHPEVINYSIAFRMQSGADDVLKYIGSTDAARSNNVNFKSASTYTDIMDMILGVFRPKDVSLTDYLSEYVNFYEEQPDVQVIMKPKAGGDPIVLWNGYNDGSGTDKNTYIHKYYNSSNNLIMEDREIVKNVIYSRDEEGEKITVQFDPEYTLDQEYTYELSFNVKASDEAYDTYAITGYDKTGDKGTDYIDNETSSEKPGLRSNNHAYARFINDESTNNYVTASYNHPVIQADRCELKLVKVDQYEQPLKGAEFTLSKDGEEAGTYTVNENGEVTIPASALTAGSYVLRESKAPKDCVGTEEEISFQVSHGMITHEELSEDSDWVWGQTPEKVTDTVNGNIAYPKNQLYKYDLKVINTSKDSPILDPGTQPEVESDYEHHKTIDYLGDGEDNDLTTLSGEDLYRLNLDITGMTKPVDLLFVIDTSGSMKGSEPATNEGITNGMPEVIKFLNGLGNGTYGYDESVNSFNNSNCDGFIKEFFEVNKENRLAIAAFAGYDPGAYHYDLSSNPSFTYQNDAWVIKDWNNIGDTYSSVPVAEGYYPDYSVRNRTGKKGVGLFIEDSSWVMGTDYAAGLMVASDLFDELDSLGNGGKERTRMMVFISDGDPTYSIVDAPANNAQYPSFNGWKYQRRGQGRFRYYDRTDTSYEENPDNSYGDNWLNAKASYDRYQRAHTDVVNYSIAFRVHKESKQEVLKYMGSTDEARTNQAHFSTASEHSEMMDTILGTFRPRDVSITDRLTEYVTLYQEQPDVKVTMTPKDGGETIVLWNGYNTGAGTEANTYENLTTDASGQLIREERPIIKSVTYIKTGDAEQIAVQFDPYFRLNPSNVFALSFNVKATDEAYNKYTTEGYDQTGDEGTDYKTNITSSGKPGLNSNVIAVTKFLKDEQASDYTIVGYDDPVIQVDQCDLKLKKTDENGNILKGAEFTLKKEDQEIGTYLVGEDGMITIPHNILTTGTYSLAETSAPEHYLISDEAVSFQVKQGMIIHDQTGEESNWSWDNDPQKVVLNVNQKDAYPKNQFYHYNLVVKNEKEIVEREVLLQKIDNLGNPLEGAKFTLYKDASDETTRTEGAREKTFTIHGEDKNIWVNVIADDLVSKKQKTEINDVELEVDALIYSGRLEAGIYYLFEESAPAKYNKLTEPVVIHVGEDLVTYEYEGRPLIKPVRFGDEEVADSARIVNTDGYELPHTGGIGTTNYYKLGMMLIIIALSFGFCLRRKQERRIH